MEKRSYVKPVLSGEEFVPQNYIAACGDSGTVYNFKCNSGGGPLYYYPNGKGEAIYENGVQKGWKGSEWVGDLSNCTKTHQASSDNVFPWGFVDTNENGYEDQGESVRLYIEWGSFFGSPYIKNAHATRDLDPTTWETAKS